MSYEIFYDKQFIALPNNQFMPMVLAGSNNCYMAGRGNRDKRSRSWFGLTYELNGRRYGTPQEYLDAIEAHRKDGFERSVEQAKKWQVENPNESIPTEADYNKSYGYYTSIAIGGSTRKTTFGMYKGIYTTGFRKALTVEQLREHNIFVNVHTYLGYGSETEARIKKLGLEEFNITVNTSQELVDLLAEKDELFKDTGVTIYVGLEASENTMKRLRKKLFPTAKAQMVWEYVDMFYILENSNGYFVKNTRNGYRYSGWTSSAKKFLTEKDAAKAVTKMGTKNAGWVPRLVNERAQVKVSKKIIKDLVA